VSYDPVKGRWYLDSSWKAPARPVPSLESGRPERRTPRRRRRRPGRQRHRGPVHHRAPAFRAARARARRAAPRRRHHLDRHSESSRARAVVIENLNVEKARAEGRERTGNRPSRGKPGRNFRRAVAGIPPARFRDRLAQMTASAHLPVVVADAAYSSRRGAEHWLAPPRARHPDLTGHHAAALVLGRRGLGHRARRRANGNRTTPADAVRPARARTRKLPAAKTAPGKPDAPRGPRQPPGGKTGRPHRTTAGNQAPEDRSQAPTRQHALLHGG